MAKLLTALAITVAATAAAAWILMLTIGVIHTNWLTAMPTIGYPTALLIGLLLTAQALIRGVAVLIIKDLNKPPTPPARRPTRTPDTQRVHWVNPARTDRGLW